MNEYKKIPFRKGMKATRKCVYINMEIQLRGKRHHHQWKTRDLRFLSYMPKSFSFRRFESSFVHSVPNKAFDSHKFYPSLNLLPLGMETSVKEWFAERQMSSHCLIKFLFVSDISSNFFGTFRLCLFCLFTSTSSWYFILYTHTQRIDWCSEWALSAALTL